MKIHEIYQKALLLTTVTAARAPIPVQDLVLLKELIAAEGPAIDKQLEEAFVQPVQASPTDLATSEVPKNYAGEA